MINYPQSAERPLRISEMIITPIACPDPPLLNHHGVHEPMYRRVVIRLRTADGLQGLGEGPGVGSMCDSSRQRPSMSSELIPIKSRR